MHRRGVMSLIEVSHLTKKYGGHTAISDLSFTVETGQIYGFLGPNGAGKSTTLNILTGCLAATSGEVRIDGLDIYEDADKAKRRIGYLPEIPPLYLHETPAEYLRFIAEAKGVPKKERAEQIRKVMEVTGIADVADRLIKNLSKGYRQRVGIAQALLGNPETIILDEPTVGLDPRQIIEIRNLIRELGKEHTVILSSHILSEVQEVCQTILILSHGRLVACDTPENLEKLLSSGTVVKIKAAEDAQKLHSLAAEMPAVLACESSSGEGEEGVFTAELKVRTGEEDEVCRNLSLALGKEGIALLSMTAESASLEDVFLELTREEDAAQEDGGTKPVPEENAKPVPEENAEPVPENEADGEPDRGSAAQEEKEDGE